MKENGRYCSPRIAPLTDLFMHKNTLLSSHFYLGFFYRAYRGYLVNEFFYLFTRSLFSIDLIFQTS